MAKVIEFPEPRKPKPIPHGTWGWSACGHTECPVVGDCLQPDDPMEDEEEEEI